MKFLALDCSTTSFSTAAMEDGVVRATGFEMIKPGPAERLAPMIVETMAACGWTHDMLQAYAVTTGPGSFTGLRVGLATAKALSLATGKPLIGMSSLLTMAWPLFCGEEKPPRPVVCFVQSGRHDLYVQIFSATHEPPGVRSISTIMTCRPDAAADWIPEGAWAYGQALEAVQAGLKGRTDVVFPPKVGPGVSKDPHPHAGALAGLAQATYAQHPLPKEMPGLIYVRPHYAEKSFKQTHS